MTGCICIARQRFMLAAGIQVSFFAPILCGSVLMLAASLILSFLSYLPSCKYHFFAPIIMRQYVDVAASH